MSLLPQPKKLTQAVFDGLPPEYRWAFVCPESNAFVFEREPKPHDSEFTEWDYVRSGKWKFLGEGFDTSNWQNSKIQRETGITVSQEPDLSKAPEGATHYIRVQSDLIFFKVEGDAIFCFTKSGGWKRSIVTAAEALRDPDYVAIPRPTSTGNPVNVTYDQIAKTHEDMLKQQADSLVSYDIDDMSIEQLRHGYRCLLLSGRESHLLHIKDKAAIATRLLNAESTVNTLLDALLHALPYVEDVLSNPAELACFKKGVVQKHATQIRAAIALAEKHEDGQPPQVTKSELLDSLKSLIKMHGHRDPISDKLLPSDLQPDHEIGEAMRLVFRAGGAV